MFCCWEKSVYARCEATQYTHIDRERERERHKEYIFIHKMQQLQNEQQPLKKVTKSLYIVTHLGQLPFILFT